ncbi:ead/Ea22-like family protein [Salmonella enterica]|nr:ead/Ea22-like family protein [Salmonella enterica]HCA3616230.1 ead/Ea22-like family protein [Salmonella enterica subsp. diarizonae serovar 61:i:z]EEC2543253.1 protein Ead [Salmonella enterica]EEJ1959542.1 ead/Ea22-like family protein [Salmonella enterica]EIE0339773.1 ead/Ea22-like family protein [Salmonella enterica]
MTIDKQALRERYSPKPVPKCHICGEEMTIQRMSASRITYGCTGEGDDGYFKFGRTFADEHYEKSRVTVVDVSDPDVLALLDENLQLQREKDAIEAVALALRDDMRQAREQLEAAERSIAEQSAIVAAAEKLVRCKGRYHSELNYRALAKLFGVITPDLPPLEYENVHYTDAAEVEISALRQRIQELEARVIVLPQRLSPEGYHIDEAYMVDDTEGEYLDRDAVIDAIRAAGIKVKGERDG